MIKTGNLVPQIYNTSRDFLIFEAILDVAFNSVDTRIAAVKGLHSPVDCFDENLGLLAKLFKLDTADRQLIRQYRTLIKNKGTEKSIQAIIEFCGGEVKEVSIVDTGTNNQHITYTVEVKDSFNDKLFKTLIKRILPINFQISLDIVEAQD